MSARNGARAAKRKCCANNRCWKKPGHWSEVSGARLVMSRSKDDTPSVATYADHEVITPPHKLRKAIAKAEEIDDPVARAEAALADLSSEFSTWMEAECVRLETARQNVKNEGFTKK